MGRWIDFRNDYKTMDPSFMESVWWVFSQLWKKGLVYRSFKVMPYSMACTTPLSNFEANQVRLTCATQYMVSPLVVPCLHHCSCAAELPRGHRGPCCCGLIPAACRRGRPWGRARSRGGVPCVHCVDDDAVDPAVQPRPLRASGHGLCAGMLHTQLALAAV